MSDGLALPNILFYNSTNHARIAAQRLNEYLEITDSCDSCCCTPFTMLSLLTKDITEAPAAITQNSLISSTIRSWHNIMRYWGRNNKMSFLTLLIQNAEISPGIDGTVFNWWHYDYS